MLATKPSRRYGVPALILYLGVGFVFGNGGQYDFLFDYPEYVSFYSQLAIGLIVFVGGLTTPSINIQKAWKQGLALSTIGVVVTSVLIGGFCYYVFGLNFLSGFLIGAILSATDAAAVYSILEVKKLRLKENIAEILEFESTTNDPFAYFLTITLTGLIATQGHLSWFIIGDLLSQTFFGIFLGGSVGLALAGLLRKFQLEIKGLYPVLILAVFLIILGASPRLGANSLLALFVAGFVIGNFMKEAKDHAADFFGSFSWLMQISLFIVLGLQSDPLRIFSNMPIALGIMLFLIFIARPVSVFGIYLFGKASKEKQTFISWVGLRGATPIAFALIPLTHDLEIGKFAFDVAFVVVCFSVLLQGSTLEWLAVRLKLVEPAETTHM